MQMSTLFLLWTANIFVLASSSSLPIRSTSSTASDTAMHTANFITNAKKVVPPSSSFLNNDRHLLLYETIRGGARSAPSTDDSDNGVSSSPSSSVELQNSKNSTTELEGKDPSNDKNTTTNASEKIKKRNDENNRILTQQDQQQKKDNKEEESFDPIDDASQQTTKILDSDSTTETESEETSVTETETESEDGVEAVVDTSEIIFSTAPLPPPTKSTILTSKEEYESLREQASQLRAHGKQLHDEGEFEQAASLFHNAASMLNEVYSDLLLYVHDELELEDDALDEIAQEAATCQLHQALCALKNQEYQNCIDACSSLLDDDESEDEEDNEYEDEDEVKSDPDISIRPPPSSPPSSKPPLSAAIRARAHHRRAKARLGLSDYDGALEDARTAAFLGDRGAVALYGRLMREETGNNGYGLGTNLGFGMDGLGGGKNDNGGDYGLLRSSGNSNPFSGMNNPFMGSGSQNPFEQFQSLMGSSSSTDPFSPSSLGSGLLSGNSSPFGSGGLGGGLGPLASLLSPKSPSNSNLAQSLFTTLSEKIQSPETQSTICNFLTSASEPQITTLASMANIPLSKTQISKIVKFSNSMTVPKIQKCVKLTKRGISTIKILRKVTKLVGKYKYLIVYLMVLQWIKSAVNRPIVVKMKKR